ncbi:MAG TPA: HNH endonuclease signature motif containing protein [Cytophagaceae bacterium]|jgi:hypothetical protein|nr:HNH endonuclease signature motif containing protein [Cytophagaceae bacterium]
MKDKKKRVKIPEDIQVEVLYSSDRTCCVCNERGKAIQIHHIDDEPSNNKIENLVVLCLYCHDDAHIVGGSGKKLNSSQVIKYRDEWIMRVKKRRDAADELASVKSVGNANAGIYYKENFDSLEWYLSELTRMKKITIGRAKIRWASGISMEVKMGIYEVIDFYQEALVELATYYPENHFTENDLKNYINEIIANSFQWHRAISDTYSKDEWKGTMFDQSIAYEAMEETEGRIIDMVRHLSMRCNINYNEWEKDWKKK